MATRTFARRPRLDPPQVPEGELDIEAPPELPPNPPANIMILILPGAMILMVVGFVVISGFNTTSIMMGSMMVVMTIGMLGAARGGGPAKAQVAAERNDYLGYLGSVRDDIEAVRTEQRTAASWTHPAPRVLASLVGGQRMWERRIGDEDFTQIRVACGPVELASPIRPPQSQPVSEIDPISAVALSQIVHTHAVVEDMPIAVRLASYSSVSILGDRVAARDLSRAALAQLATFHGPDDLLIAAAVDAAGRREWDWLKWLPHNHHPRQVDGLGPVRMVATSIEEVDDWWQHELAERTRFAADEDPVPDQPHLVLIVDGGFPGESAVLDVVQGLAGVTVLDLSAQPVPVAGPGLQLVVRDDQLAVIDEVSAAEMPLGVADAMSVVEAGALARRLSPFRLSEGRSGEGPRAAGASDLAELLSVGDIATLDPAQTWRPRPMRDYLRVPIGVGPNGDAVELDIKESALGGSGPHGLVVGATGSGKSELLRTLVLALALTHSPEQLNLILVDFKGGATFAGLQRLPHTAAVITNLQDDLSMVDRMQDALSGEMNRRQEMLRDAGNMLNVRDYEKARAAGAPLEPLPSLFIVCDEFTELLTQKPDFAELFVAIGRLGRSLGIHLLLASQRLEEGRLRGLDSHLSYRIGLKTFSASESRTVLGVPDAYELPPNPGAGFLKVDTTSMTRFTACYVSGPHTAAAPSGGESQRRDTTYLKPVSFVSSRVDVDLPAPLSEAEPEPVTQSLRVPDRPERDAASVLDVVVGRLRGHGEIAHEVWLPPLHESATLDMLLGAPTVQPGRGLACRAPTPGTLLRACVGIVDRPYEQRRDPLVLDFSGAAGNGVVVGGTQSGKSVALRTMMLSLALTHTPQQVQFYVIDLSGGALAGAARLPHVGGVAPRSRPDVVRRTVAEVAGVMAHREALFRDLGIESMADFRTRQREGDPAVADDAFGDVFLVIDGWAALREEFEDLETKVTSMTGRSLSFGVHVIITASRWQEVRPAIKDSLLARLELRLGDPTESEVDRRVAPTVPMGAPGRGLTAPKHHLQTALPRIDGSSDPATLATGFAAAVRAVADAWDGRPAPRVRMLPERIELATVEVPEPSRGFPIGISEEALAPVMVDLAADPHLLYFADGESGKTTFLKTVATGIMAAHEPADVRMLVVDYRRTLLGFVPPDYLAGYAPSAAALEALLADLVTLLRSRLPGPDVTAEQLRTRSWWTGPDAVVLIDDYDLVAGSMNNPLIALRELLPQAKDIGLRVVLTRRCAGASRALYDPLIQSIRELGAPGFVGTGAADEGALLPPAKPNPTYPPGRGMLVTRRAGAQLIQVATPATVVEQS